MAIAFDTAATVSDGSAGNNYTLSSASTVAGATLGLLFLNFNDVTTTISSITWGAGNNMTQIAIVRYNGNRTIALWAINNPPSGVQTISVNRNATIATIDFAMTYTGTDTATLPSNTANNATASATTLSKTITTAKANSWVVNLAYELVGNTAAYTVGATRRLGNNGAGGSSRIVGDSNSALSAGNYTDTFTWTGSGSAGILQVEIFVPPVTLLPSVSDSPTITESVTINIVSKPNVSDTVTITESNAVNEVYKPSVSDSITVTESVTLILIQQGDVVNDTVTVTDIPTIRIGPIFFDATSSSPYEAALSTYNWQHTVGVGTNSILVIGVAIFASGQVSSITAGTKNAVFVRADSNGVYRSEIWIVINPDVGAQTITVNLSASVTSIAGAVSYFGVDQVANFDGTTGTNGIGGSNTVNITTVNEMDTIIDVTSTLTNPIAVGAGQLQRVNTAGALGSLGIGDRQFVSPAATKIANWTGTGVTDPWAITAIGLIPSQDVDNLSTSDAVTVNENVTVFIPILKFSISDTVTITENLTPNQLLMVVTNDTVTITESVTISEAQYIISVSDTATIAESVTMMLIQQGDAVSDTVTITEAVTMQQIYTISVSDTVTVAESVTTLLPVLTFSVFDTITITENVAPGQLQTVVVNDALTITESITIFLVQYPFSVSDSVTVSESVQIQMVDFLSVSDVVTITESVALTIILGGPTLINVNDAVTVSESVTTVQLLFVTNMAETWGLRIVSF